MSNKRSSFVKVERRAGLYLISVMRSVPNGHVLGARGVASVGDLAELAVVTERCINEARAYKPRWENQANGNS